MRIRLGTRGSELARTQSGHVADALRALGHDVDLVTVRTEGDVRTGSLLTEGGTGLFAAALRQALLEGDVDIAVHSFKDLPTASVPGLVIGAVPLREAPEDVLCARDGMTLAELPPGSRIGTGSPRRAAQLRLRRPDIVTVDIRGNVGTRLARVHGGQAPADLDAVVLARAGLSRLGILGAVTEVLDLVPAAAQGALAVECRASDAAVLAVLAELDHRETRLCVEAERAVLAELEAGCAAPIAVHAVVSDGRLILEALIVSADSAASMRLRHVAPLPVDAEAVGRELARSLLRQGAGEVTPLGSVRESRLAEFHDDQALWAATTVDGLVGRRVLVPRADGPLAAAIRAAGADVECVPLTRTIPLDVKFLPHSDWIVLSSPAALSVLVDAGIDPESIGDRVAVMGTGTQRAATQAGIRVDAAPTSPGSSGAAALLASFPEGPGTVVVPSSDLAPDTLAEGLRALGWTVRVVATYTTASASADPELQARWAAGEFDAVVITAGSGARAVVELLGAPPATTRVIAFGQASASAAKAAGLRVSAVADTQDGPGLVAALTPPDRP